MALFIRTLSVLFILSAIPSYAQEKQKILIASASDLRFALDSVVKTFEQANDGTIEVVYGSSGKLFEQISNGAPFDLYFSADTGYPERLREKGLTASDLYIYGIGRLVLWSKKIDPNEKKMHSLLLPSMRKVAIANPRHAPYGKKAVETLDHYKIHETIGSKLVYGENISQTAQFVTSGAADIGLIALSLALSPNMEKQKGKYYLIPGESHQQLDQGAVITKRAAGNKLAGVFMEFIKSDTADAVFSFYGFTRPESND